MLRLFVCCLLLGLTQTVIASELQRCADSLLSALTASQRINATLYDYCQAQGMRFSADEIRMLNAITIDEDESLARAYAIRNFLIDSDQSIPYRGLDSTDIEQLVAQLDLDRPEQALSFWQKFLNWLKSQRQDLSEEDYQWLDSIVDWLERIDIPEWLVSLVLRGSIILLLLMAISFVVYEMRQNGLLRKRQRKHKLKQQNAASGNALPEHKPGWSHIQSQPLDKRFRAMFAYLLDTLTRLNWLPDNPSLTHLELAQSLTAHQPDKTEAFNRALLLYSDHVYGDQPVDNDTVDKMHRHINALITTND